ncbi:hypothetical protein DSO57_1026721 [Entomophthora muscae]|uniref:Uncharacterized protein n=1 Tax=Entomophthora muscae TaxID=34485 RepID=A0ACC2UBE8_9FUNG|nr:hypothetical protein DSO57_1026721 [Entomophthora muscae]
MDPVAAPNLRAIFLVAAGSLYLVRFSPVLLCASATYCQEGWVKELPGWCCGTPGHAGMAWEDFPPFFADA